MHAPPPTAHGSTYVVYAGSLGFSVGLFSACALVAIGIILLRRLPWMAGGELGGPRLLKRASSVIFICLWLLYISLSALEAFDMLGSFSAPKPPGGSRGGPREGRDMSP